MVTEKQIVDAFMKPVNEQFQAVNQWLTDLQAQVDEYGGGTFAITPYVTKDITTSSQMDITFSPLVDYNDEVIDMTGLPADLTISTLEGTVVLTLTSAAGQIVMGNGSMRWVADLSSIPDAVYTYELRIDDGTGYLIPRMKGDLTKTI